jgi:hypothetical protein
LDVVFICHPGQGTQPTAFVPERGRPRRTSRAERYRCSGFQIGSGIASVRAGDLPRWDLQEKIE